MSLVAQSGYVPPDPEEVALVAEEFFKYLQTMPEGVSQRDAQDAGYQNSTIVLAANALLKQGRVSCLQMPDGSLLYKVQDAKVAQQNRGLSEEALLVLQLIRNSDNKGIWTRELKLKSNLQHYQISKATKTLEERQLIKSVKSIQFKNRRVWMSWEVEPAREVSGGIWYEDGEFNENRVESLRSACRDFLKQQEGCQVHLKDLQYYIRANPELAASGSPPNDDALAGIMKTLELDGVAVCLQKDQLWQLRSRPVTVLGQEPLNVPCLQCGLRRECHPTGVIRPTSCEYLRRWMEGDEWDTEDPPLLPDANMTDW